ncbi:MAG: hypothetical protein R3330_08065, partial [Saprospiraceae bacterium]|nr:hypothetical protein [Saprospiraceae bacterium]
MKHTPLIWILGCLTVGACSSHQNNTEARSISLEESPATPQVFAAGVISTPMSERDITIAPDGRHLLFSVATPDQSVRAIAEVIKENDSWIGPTVVPFSGVHDDLEPAFAPDGQTLFFVSNRPLNDTDSIPDHNIWQVTRS